MKYLLWATEMIQISSSTLAFIQNLKKNNTREWFNSHKVEFKRAQVEFSEFVHELAMRISVFDSSIKKALLIPGTVKIFRIYRDVRFSKDKSPYKTNFGGVITAGGMEGGNPGYYLHLQPGESFFGGGLHMPSAPVLGKIRDAIDQDAKPLRTVVTSANFRKYFHGLETYDSLKTVPRGYDKQHPDADLLKLKSLTVFHQLSNSQITEKDFLEQCVRMSKAMKPFNDYLRTVSL